MNLLIKQVLVALSCWVSGLGRNAEAPETESTTARSHVLFYMRANTVESVFPVPKHSCQMFVSNTSTAAFWCPQHPECTHKHARARILPSLRCSTDWLLGSWRHPHGPKGMLGDVFSSRSSPRGDPIKEPRRGSGTSSPPSTSRLNWVKAAASHSDALNPWKFKHSGKRVWARCLSSFLRWSLPSRNTPARRVAHGHAHTLTCTNGGSLKNTSELY